jgi:chromosome segregation ATPase
MSSIEERLNSLKEAFVGKSAEAEAKALEVNALNAKVEELTAAVAAKDTLAAEVVAKVASLEASLKDAVAKAEALMKEKAAMEASFETAGKKAAKIAASVGVEPLEVSPGSVVAEAKTDDEVAQEWAAMKQKDAKAASEFYTKNRSAILRASGLR